MAVSMRIYKLFEVICLRSRNSTRRRSGITEDDRLLGCRIPNHVWHTACIVLDFQKVNCAAVVWLNTDLYRIFAGVKFENNGIVVLICDGCQIPASVNITAGI